MDRAVYYRRLAEEIRRRSGLTADSEAREQLKTAAREYEQIAQEAEDKDDEDR